MLTHRQKMQAAADWARYSILIEKKIHDEPLTDEENAFIEHYKQPD